jgi:hypothetical protein
MKYRSKIFKNYFASIFTLIVGTLGQSGNFYAISFNLSAF